MRLKKIPHEREEVRRLISVLTERTSRLKKPIRIMEICGTHTMDISRYGLRKILPVHIGLISGPGCPVCVTPIEEIDRAVEIAKMPDVIVTTFGDMMRVPGTRDSLSSVRSAGADVRIVYSPEEPLAIARENPGKQIVFIGIGFETTAPTVALAVRSAKQSGLKNYSVLAAFKTVIPPMEALLADKDLQLDGFLAPGHVSAIIGAKPYEELTRKHKIPCVITGFEALDILSGILMIVNQHLRSEGRTEIQYKRVVRHEGNPVATEVIREVFEPVDTRWRGIGLIPKSGLGFGTGYAEFDATAKFHPDISFSREPEGCRCGEVLKGILKPPQCPLFGRACDPEDPVGACMVSGEGSCAAYYRYER